jgi:hypothetical protein
MGGQGVLQAVGGGLAHESALCLVTLGWLGI